MRAHVRTAAPEDAGRSGCPPAWEFDGRLDAFNT
jgi:hypothetical protein